MKKIQEHMFLIFISALLFAVLYNLGSIWKFQEIVNLKGEQHSNEIYWGIVSKMIYVFVKFFFVALLNFLIFDKIHAKIGNKLYRYISIILANILIIFLLAYIQGLINKLSYQKPIYLSYYMWKDIFIVIPSLAFTYIIIFATKMKTVQLENMQLKELNTKAELLMLKEQLNPHFMFNTLNSLSAVIRISTKEASLEMVDDISSVYRYILDNEQTPLIQLKDEINFLNSYFKILKKRFNEGLVINIHIAEEFLLKDIPPLSLQILIENVVKFNTPLH